jgi:hypothetical protein
MASVLRRLLLYVFLAAVGILGGRISGAAWLFTELGWTATWLEISNWGPTDQGERVSTPAGEAVA